MESLRRALAPCRCGLVLCLIAVLAGFGVGGAFGAADRELRAALERRAREAHANLTAAELTTTVDKSLTFLRRSHVHGSGMGTTGVVLVLLVCVLDVAERSRRAISMCLGAGACGYSLFLLLAAWRMATLGDTHAVKASLAPLAIPAAGLFVMGTVWSLVCVTRLTRADRPADAPAPPQRRINSAHADP